MAEKRLEGKKVLMVIAPENFRDEELNHPKEILEREGASVTIASSTLGECRGMLGARARPGLLIKDARSDDYDAVVVVGGAGSPTYLWPDSNLHQLLKEAKEKGKVIGGICLSGAALARAGVLKGVEATVFATPESLKEMEKGEARYIRRPVVASGKIVTAEGPASARDFGRAIADKLSGD